MLVCQLNLPPPLPRKPVGEGRGRSTDTREVELLPQAPGGRRVGAVGACAEERQKMSLGRGALTVAKPGVTQGVSAQLLTNWPPLVVNQAGHLSELAGDTCTSRRVAGVGGPRYTQCPRYLQGIWISIFPLIWVLTFQKDLLDGQ